jgi:putative SOS response-associated peptidase YedK
MLSAPQLQSVDRWIDPKLKDVEELKGILESSRVVELDMYPVSDYVSNAGMRERSVLREKG